MKINLDVSSIITILSECVCNDVKSHYFQHITGSIHSLKYRGDSGLSVFQEKSSGKMLRFVILIS